LGYNLFYMAKMTLSEELKWRGFVDHTTFGDLSKLDDKKWTFYHGFDASADSQTIGNLAAMMFDKVFMRHGCRAILLAGGATSMIGDPGGKDVERKLQSEKIIDHNVKKAEEQLNKVFIGYDFKLVNNLDWTKDMTVMEFLRDIGKHFSMTPLVQRDYIAKRMGEGGSGISYTEFSYTLLQGMDYLHLHDKYGVDLQLGGTDQWGNCLSGVDLVRKARGKEVHVITLPLIINKTTGKKFGKTEEGAVWLDAGKTSVYQFYQYWLNVDDEGVEDYLKVYTELDKDEIDGVMAKFNSNKAERIAQKTLAYEVTKIVHAQKRADEVKKVSEVLFGQGDFLKLAKDEIDILKAEMPVVSVSKGDDLTSIIVKAGLATSNSEANRFIESGGIYINNVKTTQVSDMLFKDGDNLLRRGKNDFAIIELK